MVGIHRNRPVLFVMPSDRLGGAETILKIVMRTLATRVQRIEVVFISHKAEGNWEDLPENIHTHTIPSATEKGGLIPAARLIKKLCRMAPFQATFSSHSHVNAYLGLLRKAGTLKTDRLIVRESSVTFDRYKGGFGRFMELLYRTGYPAADLVIAQTDYMRERLLDYLPPARGWNLRTIHSPFDVERVRELEQAEVPPLTDRPYVVSAGRLERVKAFDQLIRAFAQLPAEEDLALVILGEGSERKMLEELAKELGLRDRVILPGFVSNPIPYFREARLCAASSRIEGFSNVILQMMSQHAAIATTLATPDYGRLPGVFTCPPGNPEALAGIMSQALRLSAEEQAQNRRQFAAYLAERSPEKFIEAAWKASE
ncbi:glycosyltransferase [Roseivirga sp. BDSF3-8]|uniref:glycosyltransferase n=1 Tax=Roseivirga sp. BDSF3-8 TaxID=3241598 RepID=UPI003531FB95